MASELRTENFIMRLSPTEFAMLKALADVSGLSAADILRTCIRTAHADIFGPPAAIAAYDLARQLGRVAEKRKPAPRARKGKK